MASIKHTSDGVPQYGGEPKLLPLYKEEALQYLMTIETRKRYLVGPRLAKELTGVAKVAIRTRTTQDPQWLSHPRGTYQLLEFLEQFLAKPTLVESSRYIMKFFYNLRRRRGETMTEWVARHSEALWEASSAMRKVQKEFGGTKHSPSGAEAPADGGPASTETNSTDDGMDGHMAPDASEVPDPWSTYRRGSWGSQTSSWWSSWQSPWNSWGTTWQYPDKEWLEASWRSKEYAPPTLWDVSNESFIPDFLAGFLLLHRAGLDTAERANILAAIRGQFGTETVAWALREQWSDEDLARRDKAKMAAAYFTEHGEDLDDEILMADDDGFDVANLDDDDQEAYVAEQSRIDYALAAIQNQKATLKEARWKQRQIKLGRNFYPPKPFQSRSSGSSGQGAGSGKGGTQCFRCGGPHGISKCPRRSRSQRKWQRTRRPRSPSMRSKCTIPTRAMCPQPRVSWSNAWGPCAAGPGPRPRLGPLMPSRPSASSRSGRRALATSRRPTFKFGNGNRKTCLSAARMALKSGNKPGSMEVHVHDTPRQPVLVSRKALRSLKAVVDFGRNEVIYEAVDPYTVVSFSEAPNGHLLVPLTGNLIQNGSSRATAFAGLRKE